LEEPICKSLRCLLSWRGLRLSSPKMTLQLANLSKNLLGLATTRSGPSSRISLVLGMNLIFEFRLKTKFWPSSSTFVMTKVRCLIFFKYLSFNDILNYIFFSIVINKLISSSTKCSRTASSMWTFYSMLNAVIKIKYSFILKGNISSVSIDYYIIRDPYRIKVSWLNKLFLL
jgi:hypothetical protein